MRAATTRRRHDPTIYPVEERVGEDILQRWIAEVLRPLLQRWLSERGVKALVGADQFIFWRQHDPIRRVAPDIYVLPGVAPERRVRSWKIWEHGIVPSFALEVVSGEWEKDYCEAPERYAEIGVAELILFDPDHAERPEGFRWQVYRKLARRGLVRVEVSNADRVRSRSLGCWLRAVGEGDRVRLRIGAGARGEELVPTAEERFEAERRAKEAARAAEATERAEKEAALRRVKELEAELQRRSR